jgi:hypothetical protein
MASSDRADLPVRYHFISAAIGQIDCQRIGMGALFAIGEGAAFMGDEPERTARRFLQQVGRRPDDSHPRGALLTDDEVAAVSEAELEEFAEKTLVENEYLTREQVGRDETGGEDDRPRTLYGDALLERETGESAINFLARAVAAYPERRATSARRLMASGVGQSGIASLRDVYSSAARLAGQTGASHHAAASIAQSLRARGVPTPNKALAGVPSAETSALIERVATMPVAPRASDVTLEKLEERVTAFSANLGPDEHVVLISVSAPAGVSFFVQEREAIGREMISLKGFDADGGVIEVVQHYTQFNVALMAVPKAPVRDSIGFTAGRGPSGAGGGQT